MLGFCTVHLCIILYNQKHCKLYKGVKKMEKIHIGKRSHITEYNIIQLFEKYRTKYCEKYDHVKISKWVLTHFKSCWVWIWMKRKVLSLQIFQDIQKMYSLIGRDIKVLICGNPRMKSYLHLLNTDDWLNLYCGSNSEICCNANKDAGCGPAFSWSWTICSSSSLYACVYK